MRKLGKLLLIWTVLSALVLGGCSQKDKDIPDDSTNIVEADNESVSKSGEDIGNDASSVDIGIEEDLQDDNKAESGNEDKKEDNEDKEEIPVKDVPLIEGGIKGVYGPHGMLTGTCINEFVLDKFSDHILDNYNSITSENDMKPEAIISYPKSVEAGDIVVEYPQKTLNQLEWAKNNNMKARGHVLVWHSQTPQWIFYKDFDISKGLVDRDTMLARMESYIRQNFELLEKLGYSDLFYAYDIVNEAINDDGSLRDSLWKQTIGDDYIWYAFYYADKYAPEHIKLFYNDYNEQFKTDYIIKLAESLVDDNGRSLIDGIGCQGHLYTKDSIDDYIKTLEAFSATGLDVQITEIEVSLGTWQNILKPTEENLKEQGQYYYTLINRIIEGKKAGTINLSAITFWGVADSVSWRWDRNPLLFDMQLKPKYAYFGAVQDYEHAGY